jgi:hypothetical protein
MNKHLIVKDSVDVQVLGTKNNVVSIGANNDIDFAIFFKFDKLPLSLKAKEHSQNLSHRPASM